MDAHVEGCVWVFVAQLGYWAMRIFAERHSGNQWILLTSEEQVSGKIRQRGIDTWKATGNQDSVA